jgi:hypothetical protein
LAFRATFSSSSSHAEEFRKSKGSVDTGPLLILAYRFSGHFLLDTPYGLPSAWTLQIARESEEEGAMARYGKAASKSVRSAIRRKKKGTLRSGKSGKGGTVKSRKQAIAIGLSEARKKGAKVPEKPSV